MMYTAIQI